MNDDALDRVAARERAAHRQRRWRRARRYLVIHAWVYVAVNAAWLTAWLVAGAMGDARQPGFLPGTIGWAVALLVHALAVYRPWRQRRTRAAPLE